MTISPANVLLQVNGLSKRFSLRHGLFARSGPTLTAIDRVNLNIEAGQIVGLVGESGSGKSTLGRAILQLIRADDGSVVFHGEDLCKADAGKLNTARQKLQVIFQDPLAALSPRRTVLQSLLEPLEQFEIGEKTQRRPMCEAVLETVGLDREVLDKLPHQLSSGQRQRIGIARAVLSKPDLIIADEAVSALDVSVQAQVLELIRSLRSELGIAFLFISHDLAVISQVADVVVVMYQGQIVETGTVDSLFERPSHPYTKELLAAIPDPDPTVAMQPVRANSGLSREAQGQGCAFADRCLSVMPHCHQESPAIRGLEQDRHHHVKCHLYPESQSST